MAEASRKLAQQEYIPEWVKELAREYVKHTFLLGAAAEGHIREWLLQRGLTYDFIKKNDLMTKVKRLSDQFLRDLIDLTDKLE